MEEYLFCTSFAGHDGGRAFPIERSMVQHPFGNPGIQGFPGDEKSLSGSRTFRESFGNISPEYRVGLFLAG